MYCNIIKKIVILKFKKSLWWLPAAPRMKPWLFNLGLKTLRTHFSKSSRITLLFAPSPCFSDVLSLFLPPGLCPCCYLLQDHWSLISSCVLDLSGYSSVAVLFPLWPCHIALWFHFFVSFATICLIYVCGSVYLCVFPLGSQLHENRHLPVCIPSGEKGACYIVGGQIFKE